MNSTQKRYMEQAHVQLNKGDRVEVRKDLKDLYTTLVKTKTRLDQRGKTFEIVKIETIGSGWHKRKRYHLHGLKGVKWERGMLIKIDREENEI